MTQPEITTIESFESFEVRLAPPANPDSFIRDESGNWRFAIGESWESVSPDREAELEREFQRALVRRDRIQALANQLTEEHTLDKISILTYSHPKTIALARDGRISRSSVLDRLEAVNKLIGRVWQD